MLEAKILKYIRKIRDVGNKEPYTCICCTKGTGQGLRKSSGARIVLSLPLKTERR